MHVDIKDLDKTGLRQELSDWVKKLEKVVPQEWILQFGELSQFEQFTENLLWEYDQIQEQLDEVAEERENWRGKYEDLKEELEEVLDDIENAQAADGDNVALENALKTLKGLL